MVFCFLFASISFSELNEEGMVAYYALNGDLHDDSGNGNEGITVGTALTEDRNGNENSAYFFNGNNYAIIKNTPSLTLFSQITMTAWVKLRSLKAEPIFWKGDCYLFQVSDKVETTLWNEDRTYIFLDGQTELETETWYFVAFTYDGSALSVYVNGKLDGVIFFEGNIKQGTDDIYIGSDQRYSSYYDGNLDDIRVFNRALSAHEILDLYGQAPMPASGVTFSLTDITIAQEKGYQAGYQAALEAASLDTTICSGDARSTIDKDLNIHMPDLIYDDFAYNVYLLFYPNPQDPEGAYWQLSTISLAAQ